MSITLLEYRLPLFICVEPYIHDILHPMILHFPLHLVKLSIELDDGFLRLVTSDS